jgi:DNA-binding MarR family transcriptional regulator
MPFAQLKLKNQLCHRLYMASNSIVRAYREPLRELNLTYPQYMTQILKKMADKCLLQMLKNHRDKRQRFVQLTQLGQDLKLEAVDIPYQIGCKFDHIDSEQTQQLMQLLDLVVNDLTE